MALVIGQVRNKPRPRRNPDGIVYKGDRMAVVVDASGLEYHIHDKQRRYLNIVGPMATFGRRKARYLKSFPPRGTWVVMEVPPDHHPHGARPEAISWCDLDYYRKKWWEMFGKLDGLVPFHLQPELQKYLGWLIVQKQNGHQGIKILEECGGWIITLWRQLGISLEYLLLMAFHFLEDVPADHLNVLWNSSTDLKYAPS